MEDTKSYKDGTYKEKGAHEHTRRRRMRRGSRRTAACKHGHETRKCAGVQRWGDVDVNTETCLGRMCGDSGPTRGCDGCGLGT